MLSRTFFIWLTSCVALFWSSAASTEPYPARPVTLVVPYSAGSGVDVLARIFAPNLAQRLGQTIIIRNKPGAGSLIGTSFVAKSAPDGYTLMLTTNVLPMLPALYKSVPFDPVTDFTHISQIATGSMALVVNPKVLPIKSFGELVARARAHPGKLNYGSPGIGTPQHLSTELLKQKLGLDIVHVPYKGATGAYSGLLSGQVPLMISTVNGVLPYVKAGQLAVIAVSGKERSMLAPEAKTFEELGLKNLDIDIYFLISGPANLPPEIVSRLNADTAGATNEVRDRLRALGLDPKPSTPSGLAALIRADATRWKEVVMNAHIPAH